MLYNRKYVPKSWHCPNHSKLGSSVEKKFKKKKNSLLGKTNWNAWDCWTKLKHFILGQFKTNWCWPKLQCALQKLEFRRCLPQILFCRPGSRMSQESYNHKEQQRISLAVAQASQDSWLTKSTWDISNWKSPWWTVVCEKVLAHMQCTFFYSCHPF